MENSGLCFWLSKTIPFLKGFIIFIQSEVQWWYNCVKLCKHFRNIIVILKVLRFHMICLLKVLELSYVYEKSHDMKVAHNSVMVNICVTDDWDCTVRPSKLYLQFVVTAHMVFEESTKICTIQQLGSYQFLLCTICQTSFMKFMQYSCVGDMWNLQ